jgi:hypothetical protein
MTQLDQRLDQRLHNLEGLLYQILQMMRLIERNTRP